MIEFDKLVCRVKKKRKVVLEPVYPGSLSNCLSIVLRIWVIETHQRQNYQEKSYEKLKTHERSRIGLRYVSYLCTILQGTL